MKFRIFGLVAIAAIVASTAAFAQSPGFYDTPLVSRLSATCSPSGAAFPDFTKLYYSPPNMIGYNNQGDYIAIIQFPISSTNGTVVSGTDTWNFYPSGTGYSSVSGPFSFTLTPIDVNSFMVDGTYTVFQAISGVSSSCSAHIQFVGVRTGEVVGMGPTFAGTPGQPNCQGKSVSALAQQYGGLAAAAAALHYSSVQMLQNAIAEYCAGEG